jgi:hypothetical protein
MFFIIAEYVNKISSYIFKKVIKLYPDIEEELEEDYNINIVIPVYYSSQEELDALV